MLIVSVSQGTYTLKPNKSYKSITWSCVCHEKCVQINFGKEPQQQQKKGKKKCSMLFQIVKEDTITTFL